MKKSDPIFLKNMQYFRKKRPKMAEFKPINLATVRHQFIKISVIFRSVAKHTSTYCCLLASGHIRVRGLWLAHTRSRSYDHSDDAIGSTSCRIVSPGGFDPPGFLVTSKSPATRSGLPGWFLSNF